MFKRIALLLTALTLALTLSLGMLAGTPEAASAAPENPGSSRDAVELCQSEEAQEQLEFLGLNMGECVNFFAGIQTENTSRIIVGICGSEFFRELYAEFLEVEPFANKGQCVSALQAFVRAES